MRIAFSGFTIDCTVDGEVELTSDRLRDQLNDDGRLVVVRAVLVRLGDGSEVGVLRLELQQDEIYAVDVGPPRGEQSRRLHTVRHHTLVVMGPYRVVGLLHERPGVVPMGGMRANRPFVAFTEATISFDRAGVAVDREAETLLVNSQKVSWMGDPGQSPGEPDAPRHRIVP